MPTSVKQISFLKYNNYANRTTHPGDTFEDIFGTYNVLTGRYANEIARISEPKLWNPNDGITTTIVTPNGVNFSTEPDYLVVWFTVSDEIESRWFVTETVRLHQGQYQCLLRRDVFSEAWDELMGATCYIRRAILPKHNSLIYNPEPISVNQIINKEIEIKDPTNCPWLVIYSSETPKDNTVNPPVNIVVPPDPEEYDAIYTGTKEEFEAEYTRFYMSNGLSVNLEFCYKVGGQDPRRYMQLNPNSAQTPPTPSHASSISNASPTVTNPALAQTYSEGIAQQPLATYYNNVMRDPTDPDDLPIGTLAEFTAFNKTYANRRVYCTQSQKVYYVDYHWGLPGKSIYINGSTNSAFSSLAGLAKDKYIQDCTDISITSWDPRSVGYVMRVTPSVQLSLSEIFDSNVTLSFPTAVTTQDSPYNVWCLPYGDITVKWQTAQEVPDDPDTPEDEHQDATYDTYVCNKDLNLRAINTVLRLASTNAIYDAQILPYCPLPQSYVKNDGTIVIPYGGSNLTNKNTMKDSANNTVGFIFTVPYTTFERTILLSPAIEPEDEKLDDMTRIYRIWSPNYSSSFEFSVAKNNGLTGFNVRCTYLPGQPYIRVAPIWGGLYGSQEFNKDPRGLICQGDYSLPRLTDAWINYVEQNKNYQSVFARQLSNMDVQRGIQKQQEQWGVAAGVLGGVTGGAIAGSAAGPWGALAGAVVGGVGAGVTGAMDLKNSEKLYQENRSYATDLHELQLGNVKAMPVGLSRTTAFNIDNRYFPVFTVYTGTAQDYAAAISFIAQRSMSVGVYGSFSSVINNSWSVLFNGQTITDRGFIQGSIVNINTVHDTHFVDALNDELSKGVYTK